MSPIRVHFPDYEGKPSPASRACHARALILIPSCDTGNQDSVVEGQEYFKRRFVSLNRSSRKEICASRPFLGLAPPAHGLTGHAIPAAQIPTTRRRSTHRSSRS